MLAFEDLPSAAEVTIGGKRQPLVPIGIVYFNGSVAIGTGRYRRLPMLVADGRGPNVVRIMKYRWRCVTVSARHIYKQ